MWSRFLYAKGAPARRPFFSVLVCKHTYLYLCEFGEKFGSRKSPACLPLCYGRSFDTKLDCELFLRHTHLCSCCFDAHFYTSCLQNIFRVPHAKIIFTISVTTDNERDIPETITTKYGYPVDNGNPCPRPRSLSNL